MNYQQAKAAIQAAKGKYEAAVLAYRFAKPEEREAAGAAVRAAQEEYRQAREAARLVTKSADRANSGVSY